MPARLVLAAALWAALIAVTLALSALAAAEDRFPADRDIAEAVQDVPWPAGPVSDSLRAITGTEVVLATGGAIAVVLWLRGHRRQAVLLALALAALPLLQSAVKEAVDRPRPDPALVEHRADFDSPSFPSGHVMSGSFLYGYLLYLSLALPLARVARPALAGVCVIVLLLAGPANVYVGVHWPSDVLGGWAWALVLLLPLLFWDMRLRRSASR